MGTGSIRGVEKAPCENCEKRMEGPEAEYDFPTSNRPVSSSFVPGGKEEGAPSPSPFGSSAPQEDYDTPRSSRAVVAAVVGNTENHHGNAGSGHLRNGLHYQVGAADVYARPSVKDRTRPKPPRRNRDLTARGKVSSQEEEEEEEGSGYG